MKIIMFGAGGMSHFLTQKIKKGTEIVAYLDTTNNENKNIDGIPVIGLDSLKRITYDYIVVAFSDVEKGFNILKNEGISEECMVGYSFNDDRPYKNNHFQHITNIMLNDELKDKRISNLFDVPTKKFFLCAMNQIEDASVETDFVREQTLSLIAKEIRRKKLNSAIAELGVFRGNFSKKLNVLFPTQTLYLFDTFEGFDTRDVESDINLGGERLRNFDNTSIEEVLSKMKFPDKCVIKKGFFPDTYDLREEKFSFVSIDVDLYDPIKCGLEIFYPRLEKGGYIMVHDYNNIVYRGTYEAVLEYCDKKGISYVPIPDIAGSIVITK